MTTVINDRETERRMIARRRRRLGHDKFDEVWNGVYVISHLANNEHQDCVGGLVSVLYGIVQSSGLGLVLPGTNVSDRHEQWKKNFRCPDVAVFLNDTKAVDCDTHWLGGPDFAIEVASRGERVARKLRFYATVQTRELLIVERYPWCLKLYRLEDGELRLAGDSTVGSESWLASLVLPLSFRMIEGAKRPRLELRHSDGRQTWMV